MRRKTLKLKIQKLRFTSSTHTHLRYKKNETEFLQNLVFHSKMKFNFRSLDLRQMLIEGGVTTGLCQLCLSKNHHKTTWTFSHSDFSLFSFLRNYLTFQNHFTFIYSIQLLPSPKLWNRAVQICICPFNGCQVRKATQMKRKEKQKSQKHLAKSLLTGLGFRK